MSEEPQVLLKVYLDPRCLYAWIGPKLFDYRLLPHDEATKFRDKLDDLSKSISKADLCNKCRNTIELCDDCLKGGSLCDECLGDKNLCQGCLERANEAESDGFHVYSTRREKSNLITFRALKIEIQTDPKVIEAFKIVHPEGLISSHHILDDIDYWYNLLCRSTNQLDN